MPKNQEKRKRRIFIKYRHLKLSVTVFNTLKLPLHSHVCSVILVPPVVCEGSGIPLLGLGKLSNIHYFSIVICICHWNCRADILFKPALVF